VASRGRAAGWGSAFAGALSVATLPVAIYLTRFSDEYELLHAAFALPVAALFGILAVVLARRARRLDSLALSGRPSRPAGVGRVLGVIGLCMVASALVALGVYWLLEYVGSRE
jgi:ABC-type Fe3+ transport system permease subunit